MPRSTDLSGQAGSGHSAHSHHAPYPDVVDPWSSTYQLGTRTDLRKTERVSINSCTQRFGRSWVLPACSHQPLTWALTPPPGK